MFKKVKTLAFKRWSTSQLYWFTKYYFKFLCNDKSHFKNCYGHYSICLTIIKNCLRLCYKQCIEVTLEFIFFIKIGSWLLKLLSTQLFKEFYLKELYFTHNIYVL